MTTEQEPLTNAPLEGAAMVTFWLAYARKHSSYEGMDALEKQQDNRSAAIAHYCEALRRFEQIQSPDAEGVRAHLRALGARM